MFARAWWLFVAALVLSSCGKEEQVPVGSAADAHWPYSTYDYATLDLPPHLAGWSALDNTPGSNPIDNAIATLGRVLFYDRELSQNRTVSCGSCHHQSLAFADTGAFSPGFLGVLTDRNSMALVNLRFNVGDRLFWDERMSPLESQVLGPIQHLGEMGMLLPDLRARLDTVPYYVPLLMAAYGDSTVTNTRIARALAQFIRSMVSYRSRYDLAAPTFTSFTAQEQEGRAIFQQRCAPCHATENFFLEEPMNNGLALDPNDTGVGFVTGDPADDGKFRPPSLRNVALTPPYMHDARFATLDEVIEHYSTGVLDHPNLGAPLRDPGTGDVVLAQFTSTQKSALSAFLHTLTDIHFLTDPKWSDPFQ